MLSIFNLYWTTSRGYCTNSTINEDLDDPAQHTDPLEPLPLVNTENGLRIRLRPKLHHQLRWNGRLQEAVAHIGLKPKSQAHLRVYKSP